MNPDSRTALADSEVKKLLTFKALAKKLPDGFNNSSRITRNPLPGAGQPAISILPAKRSLEIPQSIVKQPRLSPEGHHALPSEPNLIFSYTSDEAVSVQSFVSSLIPLESDPLTLDGAKASFVWPQWLAALNAEYASLWKHNVFGPLVTNLTSKPVGFRLIFTKKRNAEGQVVRYKVRLVAQGFSQCPGVDYTFTYSPVMDSGTFQYLLSMAVQYSLDTQLLDVVTAYLYGPLDADIHIRPPPDFLKADPFEDTPGSYSGLKLQKALYGLKQAGRMWYQHLREFLLHHDFRHDQSLPCIFTFKNSTGFVVVAVYVEDLNLVGTPETCTYVVNLLTTQFEMKLLDKTSFCLGLQVTHLPDGSIFLYQTGYTHKFLKRFGMDKANPLSTSMMGRSRTSDNPYRPCEEEEEFYDRTHYLAVVGALLYLSTFTRSDISFTISVLARHSQKPAMRYWNGVRHVLRYLRGTEDLGIHYITGGTPEIVGYADAGFKSDDISGKSQTGYIFLKNNAPISWKLVKQTVTTTSTNHLELIAFHEATQEAVWLRQMHKIITEQCEFAQDSKPTVIFKDNAAYVAQVGAGFIKTDRTKHICPEIFGFTQELIQSGQIEVKKIESAHNLADMLTKALPAHTHRKLVQGARMKLLHELLH
jgi:hypothetical protein